MSNMLTELSVLSVLLLYSTVVECDSNSDPNSHSDSKDTKEDDYYISKDDRKLRWMTLTSDYYKNHRPNNYYNYILTNANRDPKQASNSEAYFADPTASESQDDINRYEQSMSPSAIQITALPGIIRNRYVDGVEGRKRRVPVESLEYWPTTDQISMKAGYPGYNDGQYNPNPINPDPVGVAWNAYQKFPVFVINKSGGKSEKFWLLPLLLLLGAPLLLGAIFIPLTIQCVFFFFTLLRNLGFLLPLISGMTGNNGINGMNPIIPATG